MKASTFWARTVVLCSGLLLLVGCGPHIQSIRGDFKTVRVTLDDTPPNGLVLMSSMGPVSGPSSSSGRELVFNLPTDDSENAGECLYLADRRGKNPRSHAKAGECRADAPAAPTFPRRRVGTRVNG